MKLLLIPSGEIITISDLCFKSFKDYIYHSSAYSMYVSNDNLKEDFKDFEIDKLYEIMRDASLDEFNSDYMMLNFKRVCLSGIEYRTYALFMFLFENIINRNKNRDWLQFITIYSNILSKRYPEYAKKYYNLEK